MPRKPPGSSPTHPLHASQSQLQNIADPYADIPGLDDDERDKVITGVRHAARASGTMIAGAPVDRPALGDEVTALLTRSRDKGGKGNNGRG